MTITWLRTDPRYVNRLGRTVINHDPANKQYRALERTTLRRARRPGQVWWRNDVFDQTGPSCTSAAFFGLLRTSPYRVPFNRLRQWVSFDTEQERFDYYKRSQDYDGTPGTDYEGTSSDAPYKLGRQLGLITGHHWLFGEPELWEYVTNYGAASVGTVWTEDMFNPDALGYLSATGAEVGGHEWDVIQAHQEGQFYLMVNSWTRTWGFNGRARVKRAVMAELLARQGDAIVPALPAAAA